MLLIAYVGALPVESPRPAPVGSGETLGQLSFLFFVYEPKHNFCIHFVQLVLTSKRKSVRLALRRLDNLRARMLLSFLVLGLAGSVEE